MKRVVITGLGIVSPLGVGVEYTWKRLLAGDSGIVKITDRDIKDIPVHIAGLVPWGENEGQFNINEVLPVKEQKKNDTFIVYGMAAGQQAMKDCGFIAETQQQQERCGVLMGSGIGGLQTIYESSLAFNEVGMRCVSPFFIPSVLINLISGNLSIQFGLKGPNEACVSACSTGAHAIGEAYEIIKRGDADLMLAGSSEAAINVLGLGGFARMRALTADFNDAPEKASRPWDKHRSGFVMSEGAGAVVLEDLDHALARKAKIYAEVVGYGVSADAYHITTPSGEGAKRSMQAALKKAAQNGVKPQDIDYINAHGTSTLAGDVGEALAVKDVFKDHAQKLSMSSTKSSIGHLLGAAGSVEAVFSVLAIRDQICPATLNLEDIEDEVKDMDLVPLKPKKRQINVVMSNSFGFGGTNATLIFKKYE